MKTAAPSDATASEQLCGAGRGAQRACPGGGRDGTRLVCFLFRCRPPVGRGISMTHPELTEKHTMQVHASGVFGVATQFFLGSY